MGIKTLTIPAFNLTNFYKGPTIGTSFTIYITCKITLRVPSKE